MKKARFLFEKMVSVENLIYCWEQFKRGKRKRKDIQIFERHLEDNIFELHHELKTLRYTHAPYNQFYITDPKQRHISKATVRDRLVHQVVYDTLVNVLDRTFIFHSLSSRLGKGTHFGILHLQRMIRKCSANGTKSLFALKMDIRRFFDTVDHKILKMLVKKHVCDERVLKITNMIIDSFSVTKVVGLPLGNVTSQLFANLYLHELDDFVKQDLREKYYLRYCDDFIILSNNEDHLKSLLASIRVFLAKTLNLELHPKKVTIRKLRQGIDFVGYIVFEKYILIRTRSKKRMKKRLKNIFENFLIGRVDGIDIDRRLQSYLGLLSHCNQYNFSSALKNAYWMRPESFADSVGKTNPKEQKFNALITSPKYPMSNGL